MTYYNFIFSSTTSFQIKIPVDITTTPKHMISNPEGLIAYLTCDKGIIPLLSRRGSNIVFEEESLSNFLTYVLNEKAFSEDFRIWKYMPFNYRIIPLWVRNLVLKLFIKQKKQFQGGTEIEPFVCFLNFLKQNNFDFQGNGIKIFFLDSPILLLSHDIETEKGFGLVLKIADIEESNGYRSTWNVVTGEYRINEFVINELLARGHRIGWHEYRHDNRFPFLSRREMENRIKKSSWFLEKYSVKGFRSPSYLSTFSMLEVIKKYFAYDSSRLDHDVISGTRSKGCNCPFPFMLENGLMEVPVTVPFEIPFMIKSQPFYCWDNKIDFLMKNNALIHVNTHPDPHYSGNNRMIGYYKSLLFSLKEKNIKNMLIEDMVEDIDAG